MQETNIMSPTLQLYALLHHKIVEWDSKQLVLTNFLALSCALGSKENGVPLHYANHWCIENIKTMVWEMRSKISQLCELFSEFTSGQLDNGVGIPEKYRGCKVGDCDFMCIWIAWKMMRKRLFEI